MALISYSLLVVPFVHHHREERFLLFSSVFILKLDTVCRILVTGYYTIVSDMSDPTGLKRR
jgi:hypothetical protein